MRFQLVDRILDFEPGKRIRLVKNLTLAEEYLADHFPSFPVMPGVLMLETLVEAGAWLLRLTGNYQHSVIVLPRMPAMLNTGASCNRAIALLVNAEMSETASEASGSCLQGEGRNGRRFDGVGQIHAGKKRYNSARRKPGLMSQSISVSSSICVPCI